MAYEVFTYIGVVLVILTVWWQYVTNLVENEHKRIKSIAILVLGDIGRSPRMQRHAISCLDNLNENYIIYFVGFINSPLLSQFNDKKYKNRIIFYNIKSIKLTNVPFIIYAIVKIISESFHLFWILFLNPYKIVKLQTIILQNPPTIPIGIISRFVCWFRAATLIIDWHNFGFTILALKIRNQTILNIYKYVEKMLFQLSDQNLTVTKTMKKFFIDKWNGNNNNIHVLYDKPTDMYYQELTQHQQQHNDGLLYNELAKYFNIKPNNNITNPSNEMKQLKGNNLWMISSTSWTKDEDLNMLLTDNILTTIDNKIQQTYGNNNDISIYLFVTGKDEGGLKEIFIKGYNDIKNGLKYIKVYPIWLNKYETYIHLLRYCDLGLCLHNSSSGLDLPMKVVDMFGVCIPVISINYDINKMNQLMSWNNDKTAINELIIHNENGLIFNDSNELSSQIFLCFQMYKKNPNECFKKWVKIIKNWKVISWEMDWKNKILPIILK